MRRTATSPLYRICRVSKSCRAQLTSESSLLVVTSSSTIALLDIRTMGITQRFQHPLELGVISSICPSNHWLIVGSASGNLSLWDLRFGLLLKSWQAGGAITSCQIHPSRGRGRWVMVSILRSTNEESALVEVYDAETAKLMEVYEVRSTRPDSKVVPPASSETTQVIPSKAVLIAQLAAARPPADPTRTPSVLSLIVGQGFASLPGGEEETNLLLSVPGAKSLSSSSPGWMVTAGEDRVVRYWDLAKPSEGFVVCGSPKEKDVNFKLVFCHFLSCPS